MISLRISALFDDDIAFAEALDARINERGGEYQNASVELTKLQQAPAQPAMDVDHRQLDQVGR